MRMILSPGLARITHVSLGDAYYRDARLLSSGRMFAEPGMPTVGQQNVQDIHLHMQNPYPVCELCTYVLQR
jgi:hypothetical protein